MSRNLGGDERDAIVLAMARIVGREHVLTDETARRDYAHDRLPYANFCAREGRLAGVLPRLVVRPGTRTELAEIVKFAFENKVQIIPFGNGSGVLGGAIPISREMTIDLRRLDRILSFDAEDAMVTVEAGMNGAAFEQALNEKGYTCGHYPQSMEISTVGGWVACRGGGQASSRYGKIEDIVIGLSAVMPDGSPLVVRPVPRRAAGPSVADILIGGEGGFGIVDTVTLRIYRKPEIESGVTLAFPTLAAALDCAREIMQTEIRPQIARIYDEAESSERMEGLSGFDDHPILAIYAFCGQAPLAGAEEEMALAIARRHGAIIADNEPYRHWKKNRFFVYSQVWQAKGYYNDTIEIAARWSVLPSLYEAIRAKVKEIYPSTYFGAHWSHIYPEGACQYMTMRLPPMPSGEAMRIHARLWECAETLALDYGGTISHHHGVGIFRNAWLERELGGGLKLLQSLKAAIDPDNLMNPGKVGMKAPDGAVSVPHG